MTDFVESGELLCKKHHAFIRDIIKMHGLNSLQHSTWIEQFNLLVDSVRKVIWTKVVLFLEGNLASFVSICEDRPNIAWRRHVTRVSICRLPPLPPTSQKVGWG